MALPPTIYRATIQLAHVDRNRYEQLQLTVARHPSETAERLVARLLAYGLFFEEGLQFTRGICAGDEPDLWRKGPDGRVLTWVEVGVPEADRLRKASRHSGQVVLLACGGGRPRWESVQLPKLAGLSNVTVYALEQPLLDALAASLQRSIDWSLTVTEGVLYLSAAEKTLESPLHRLMPS